MSEKKRIVQICLRKNDVVAGADLFEEVARAFIDEEFYFVLLSGGGGAALEQRIGGKVINLGFRKSSLSTGNFLVYLKLFLLLMRIKPSVVITHRFKPFAYCAALSRCFPSIRFISVFHGLGEFAKRSRRSRARSVGGRWQYVAVSKAVLRDMVAAGIPEARIVVIPNAIDIDFVSSTQYSRGEARARLALPDTAKVVVTIGRMVPIKAHALLVEAIAPLLKRGDVDVLLIVGDGAERVAVERKARELGVEKEVVLAGTLENAYRYLPCADFFVLPSLTEGLPISLLEAIAARLPVIATSVGGVPEVVGDARFMPEPNSADLLRAALNALLALPEVEMQRYRDALYARLRDEFDIQTYRERYRALVG